MIDFFIPAKRLVQAPKRSGHPQIGLNTLPAQGNILKPDSPHDWWEAGSHIKRKIGEEQKVVEQQTSFTKVDYTLAGLLEFIDLGDIGLPDIQRPFVWTPTKVRDLLDSMYNGFPVGYLLFWKNHNVINTRQIGIGEKGHKVPSLLIVDGQQRLTSLYSVFKGVPIRDDKYRERSIEIAFRPRDGRFEVGNAATRKDPEYISDVSKIWSKGGNSYSATKGFISDLEIAKGDLSEEEERLISSNIDKLYDLNGYPFTALEILPNVSEEQVSDIFVRINSQGVTLNQADFILTLLSVFWEEGRIQLEEFCRAAAVPPDNPSDASAYNHFIDPKPDQLIRTVIALGFNRGRLKSAYQVLRGKDVETDTYDPERREQQFNILQEAQAEVLKLANWHHFLGSLTVAGFRGKEFVSSENALLFAYAIYLIGRTRVGISHDQIGPLIARWFFVTHLSGRYTSSPETTFDTDLSRLKDAQSSTEFVAALERIIADTVTEDFWSITLPNELETSSGRSPSLFGYYAALNVLDAPVLFSKKKFRDLSDPSIQSSKKAIERHHLFPRGHLKELSVQETRLVNQIGNYAPLEWPDNLVISDQSPAEYVPDVEENFSKHELDVMYAAHGLSKGWEQMRYPEFVEQRRHAIALVIRQAYEAITSPPIEEGPITSVYDMSAADLIASGESNQIEFKSSARLDKDGERQQFLEEVIVKAVSGFMNGDGGVLLIGVRDDGTPLGIERDLKTVKKGDSDGYELWLHDLFENWLGKNSLPAVNVKFEKVDDFDVCRVAVQPGLHPVFANKPKSPKSDIFYLRTGNSTRQLTTQEALRYISDRWD